MESRPLPAVRDSTDMTVIGVRMMTLYSSCPGFRFCASSGGGHIPLIIFKVLTQALYTLYAHSTYKNKKGQSKFIPLFEKKEDLRSEQLVFTFHHS
jgi:hypothetical protein